MTDKLESLKKEILFYYESRQNPNGDPGFENQPRLMPDGTIIVTDVRIKRTIRDYAKSKYKETLFVDYGEDGTPVKADERAKEILKNNEKDPIAGLLKRTFDVPLFGALVTIRAGKGEEKGAGSSQKLTGPVQFGIGRSVNQVQIINPMISGRFVGKEKKGKEQFSTFGKFYSVEYALIKVQGIVNPSNLGNYLSNKEIVKHYSEAESRLFDCLWNGTNSLVSRSKYPQRSIFFLEVSYDGAIYNDLPILVEEDTKLRDKVTKLTDANEPLQFTKLVPALATRKRLTNVRIAACRELLTDASRLIKKIEEKKIPAELIPTEEPQY
jgi:CRISPR-associated protein Csh2